MPVSWTVKPRQGGLITGLGMQHKVGASATGGNLFIVEGVIPPGVLVTPHTHSREDECSYILEGALSYLVGDEEVDVTAGSYVVKPRGVRHAFWNSSDRPARVLEMHTPATLEHYYDKLGAIFLSHPPGSASRREALDALASEYGLLLDWDLDAQLSGRPGLGAVHPAPGIAP